MVVGGGGREHALAWKLAQSTKVNEVISVPGNPGMAEYGRCIPVADTDVAALAEIAFDERVDFAVIGPEAWLAAGVVDELNSRGILAIGPTAAAARIESSKAFAKALMERYRIPTARYKAFSRKEEAHEYLDALQTPVWVKADGLAAGKGAIFCPDAIHAKVTVGQLLDKSILGQSGSRIVIEEHMEGWELTLLAFTDGHTVLPMVPSQDHKRAFDGDIGPNTGGMGAYSPVPGFGVEDVDSAVANILTPVVRALEAEGTPFCGFLYAGLMVTTEGPKVVEFNARFGDPEAQVVLTRLETDLVDILLAMCNRRLGDVRPEWSRRHSACVVVASGGYPGEYKTGCEIRGVVDAQTRGALVFHAGTRLAPDGRLVTGGGRVLGVVGTGDCLADALGIAYSGADAISFDGCACRRDIGWRASHLRN